MVFPTPPLQEKTPMTVAFLGFILAFCLELDFSFERAFCAIFTSSIPYDLV